MPRIFNQMDYSGILLLDKPSGISSHDLVAITRKDLGMKQVGHAGTLDPLATGCLPFASNGLTPLIEFIPKLPKMFDEPFADSSQIPTYLVSELAKKHVDVALTGDGGDELFGGYNRHVWVKSIWSKTEHLPLFVRRLIIFAITSLSPASWNRFFEMCSAIFPKRYRVSQSGDKMHKLANVILAETPAEMYRSLVSHWNKPASIVLGSNEPISQLSDPSVLPNLFDVEQRMMFLDTIDCF